MSNILLDTLKKQPLICAEGYLFEMERRGYLTSGEFVPEVALEHPEVLENLHKEFQHAGSNHRSSIYIQWSQRKNESDQ